MEGPLLPLLLLALLLRPQGHDSRRFLPGRWLRGRLQIWQLILQVFMYTHPNKNTHAHMHLFVVSRAYVRSVCGHVDFHMPAGHVAPSAMPTTRLTNQTTHISRCRSLLNPASVSSVSESDSLPLSLPLLTVEDKSLLPPDSLAACSRKRRSNSSMRQCRVTAGCQQAWKDQDICQHK